MAQLLWERERMTKAKWFMHQSFVTTARTQQDLSAMLWVQYLPCSAVELRGFWFHAQTGQSNFIYLPGFEQDFWQDFYHKNVPAVLHTYFALQRKVKIPTIPRLLQMTGALQKDPHTIPYTCSWQMCKVIRGSSYDIFAKTLISMAMPLLLYIHNINHI